MGSRSVQSRINHQPDSSVHGEKKGRESIIPPSGAQDRKIRSSRALLGEEVNQTSNSVNPTVDLRKRSQGVGSKNRTPKNHMTTSSRCLKDPTFESPNRDPQPMGHFNWEQGLTARVSLTSGFMDVILPCYQPHPPTSIFNSTTNHSFQSILQQDTFEDPSSGSLPTVRIEEKKEVLNRFFFHFLINQSRTATTTTNSITTSSLSIITTTSNTTTSRRNTLLN